MRSVLFLPLSSFFTHGLLMTLRMRGQAEESTVREKFLHDLGIKLQYITIPLHLMDSWPSGRRRTPGTRVKGNLSRVRISSCPPLFNLHIASQDYPNSAIIVSISVIALCVSNFSICTFNVLNCVFNSVLAYTPKMSTLSVLMNMPDARSLLSF